MRNSKNQPNSRAQTIGKASDVSADDSRRKALKKLLITGGVVTGGSMLPKQWSRPVVDSVVLPSHASTTNVDSSPVEPETTNYFFQLPDEANIGEGAGGENRMFAERVLDALVPTAHALVYSPYIAYACIAITGNTYTGRVIRYYGGGHTDYDNLTGTVGVNEALSDSAPGYGFCGASGVTSATILIDNVTTASCSCSINGGGLSTITVDEGSCSDPFIGECQD